MDYCVELDQDTGLYCTLHLFTNVTNTPEIHSKIVSGEFSCCAIKPSLVIDPFQVLVAANKAALNAKQNRLITKSVHTEVLFCLSMSKNISRSLTEFGIGASDKNILMIFLHKFHDQHALLEILASIEGQKVPVVRIQDLTDVNLVQKMYKIDKDELRVSNLIDAIVSRISCKDMC